MSCRSGCPTQDHGSYRACLKDTTFHTVVGEAHEKHRAHDHELDSYRAARKQGIQPASTKQRDIDAAVTLSQVVDAPYDAGKGAFKE